MKAAARQAGFTLLEVLVAITVFAVLSAGVYRVLSSMVQAQATIVTHADDLRELQRAMWIMAADIEQIAMRDVKGEFNDRLPAVVTNEDDYILQFTRQGLRNPLLFNRSDLQRIGYTLGDEPLQGEGEKRQARTRDEENRQHLLRHVWGAVDRISDTRVDTQVMLHDVEEVEFEFIDGDDNKSTKWPPKLKTGKAVRQRELPVSIRIVMKTRRYGEITRIFQLGNTIKIKPVGSKPGGVP
jgi:general secretion pathway protein J